MGGRDDAVFLDHFQLGIAAGGAGAGAAAAGGFFARRAGTPAGPTATGDADNAGEASGHAAGAGGDDLVSTGLSQCFAGAGGAADGGHVEERALRWRGTNGRSFPADREGDAASAEESAGEGRFSGGTRERRHQTKTGTGD